MIDHIKQLQEQFQSACICVAKLEKAAFANPEHGIVAELLEARAAKDACHAELQKAMWLEIDDVEREMAA
ncbi:MAG: hypothetical protein EOM22_08785 [Gammaproteobacteria bacterium]|nr:hypothetical protein [Gammaproteobacteria bacterium]